MRLAHSINPVDTVRNLLIELYIVGRHFGTVEADDMAFVGRVVAVEPLVHFLHAHSWGTAV